MVSTKYIGASISTTNESGSNTAYTICLVDVKSTLLDNMGDILPFKIGENEI